MLLELPVRPRLKPETNEQKDEAPDEHEEPRVVPKMSREHDPEDAGCLAGSAGNQNFGIEARCSFFLRAASASWAAFAAGVLNVKRKREGSMWAPAPSGRLHKRPSAIGPSSSCAN